MHYVNLNILPLTVKNFLNSLDFAKHDISITAAETVSPVDMGYVGSQSYFAVLNLDTGERVVTCGSWGGPNAFNPQNRVDTDEGQYTIPANVIVVKGSRGHLNHAEMYVNPCNLQQFLVEKPVVSPEEKQLLRMYKELTSAGRKNQIERTGMANVPALTEALVARGLLKRNKAGATQITTEGKNAL